MQPGEQIGSESPRFSQAVTFVRLRDTWSLEGVRAALLDVPFDDGTTFRIFSNLHFIP